MTETSPIPRYLERIRSRATGIAAIFLVVLVVGRFLLGFETERARAEPLALGAAEAGFPYDAYDTFLDRVVVGGGVRYQRAVSEQRTLRRVVATFEQVGPGTTPERFPDEASRLAYYINAYNAFTLFGVVAHYPIQSIHDVRGILVPKPGFGFFYAQRFRLDGRHMNLYDLEHRMLEPFGDPRVHAAINCASAGCPDLAADPYRPQTLDAQLDAAARRFASDERHVRVDDEAGQIRLSAIYEWFAEDFERMGGALAFIERHGDADVRDAVTRARESGYATVYMPYDWSLNDRSESLAYRDAARTHDGGPVRTLDGDSVRALNRNPLRSLDRHALARLNRDAGGH